MMSASYGHDKRKSLFSSVGVPGLLVVGLICIVVLQFLHFHTRVTLLETKVLKFDAFLQQQDAAVTKKLANIEKRMTIAEEDASKRATHGLADLRDKCHKFAADEGVRRAAEIAQLQASLNNVTAQVVAKVAALQGNGQGSDASADEYAMVAYNRTSILESQVAAIQARLQIHENATVSRQQLLARNRLRSAKLQADGDKLAQLQAAGAGTAQGTGASSSTSSSLGGASNGGGVAASGLAGGSAGAGAAAAGGGGASSLTHHTAAVLGALGSASTAVANATLGAVSKLATAATGGGGSGAAKSDTHAVTSGAFDLESEHTAAGAGHHNATAASSAAGAAANDSNWAAGQPAASKHSILDNTHAAGSNSSSRGSGESSKGAAAAAGVKGGDEFDQIVGQLSMTSNSTSATAKAGTSKSSLEALHSLHGLLNGDGVGVAAHAVDSSKAAGKAAAAGTLAGGAAGGAAAAGGAGGAQQQGGGTGLGADKMRGIHANAAGGSSAAGSKLAGKS